MRSFGKTLRGGASAIGLGVISAFGLAAATMVIGAPAAVAQTKASSEEFANAAAAAGDAYKAKRWAEAAQKGEQAMALGKGAEKGAMAQLVVGSYAQANNYAKVISAIEAHRALGGVSPQQETYYDRTLMNAYNQTRQPAKATEVAKKLIASGQGDAKTLGFVASNDLKAKNYKDAIANANKAIQMAGAKPPADYYNIIIAAYLETKDMDNYYKTLEKVAPIYNKSEYWKPLIDGTKKQPKFKETVYGVDLYRTYDAAKVSLTNSDQATWAESALSRGVPIEAEKVFAPLFKSGALGSASDPKAERSKGLYTKAQNDAKADKAGGLAKTEAEAANKPTGASYVVLGESHMANGDYAKAIDAFQKGLAKGQMEPGETDYAKLRLGIAQLKAGKKDDARKTWADIKSDNGSGWLARCWTAISKV